MRRTLAEFPCVSCGGQCCGPVPLNPSRTRSIQRAIDKLPREEFVRLSSQPRTYLDCGLYDVEMKRCSVYEARPELCKVYGLTRDLQCPYSPSLVTEITPAGASVRLRRDGGSKLMMSHEWKWSANGAR